MQYTVLICQNIFFPSALNMSHFFYFMIEKKKFKPYQNHLHMKAPLAVGKFYKAAIKTNPWENSFNLKKMKLSSN